MCQLLHFIEECEEVEDQSVHQSIKTCSTPYVENSTIVEDVGKKKMTMMMCWPGTIVYCLDDDDDVLARYRCVLLG